MAHTSQAPAGDAAEREEIVARHLDAMAQELHSKGHRIVSVSAKSLLQLQDDAFDRMRAILLRRAPSGE